jgi:hypothetical protein
MAVNSYRQPVADAHRHCLRSHGRAPPGRDPYRTVPRHCWPGVILGRHCSSEEIPSSFCKLYRLIPAPPCAPRCAQNDSAARRLRDPASARRRATRHRGRARTSWAIGRRDWRNRNEVLDKQKEPPREGWLFLNDVRRRPTLPHPGECSTIGAEGLSFRVRNGTGRFPLAMTAVTLWRYDSGVPARISGTAQWTRSTQVGVMKLSAY